MTTIDIVRPAIRTLLMTDVVVSGKSQNEKTGEMPTISRPIAVSCPTTCAFLPKKFGGNGLCYANGRVDGTVSKFAKDMSVSDMVAKMVKDGAIRPAGLAGNPKRLIRDRVVGDIIENGTARNASTEKADIGYLLNVAAVADELSLLSGEKFTAFGYTHAFDLMSAEDVITVADSGYVLNASANTVDDIYRAAELGMPITYAGDDLTEGSIIAGKRIVTCPVQTNRTASCATCGLCAAPQRKAIVRFLIH